MKTYVLYHANCPDGFGAALAAWIRLGDEGATYLPVSYNEPPPHMEMPAKIYILDFSYPLGVLQELERADNIVTVIDHHKTAEEALRSWDGDKIFDMHQSGAVLAYHFFHGGPNQETPLFFQYLQDRDLWRWQLPDSKEFSAALRSYPMTFSMWSLFVKDGDTSINAIIADGRAILRFQDLQVENIARRAVIADFLGFRVPVVQSNLFFSEVADKLLEIYPAAPFAAVWFAHNDGYVQYSLRSRPGFDCSDVAKLLGGGGHPQAAGCRVDRNPNLWLPDEDDRVVA